MLLDGTSYITKPDSMNGTVNKYNIAAQFLYELQGELYLNPDVVANLSGIRIEESGRPNKVRVTGIQGMPPPATTKVMIAAPGGYQTETTYYINGLDVREKAQMMQNQLKNISAAAGSPSSRLSCMVTRPRTHHLNRKEL